MGDLGGQDGLKALQETSRRRTATRAKRYAHIGFGDKDPEVREIVIYFEHRVKTQKIVPDLRAPNVTHSVISGT